MSKAQLNRLILKVLLEQQLAVMLGVVPIVYMVVLIMGLEGDLAWKIALINVSWILPVFGLAIPLWLTVRVTKNALAEKPDDVPGARLQRILEAPRRIELGLYACYGASGLSFSIWPPFVYGISSVWAVPQVVLAFELLLGIVFIWQSLRIEKVLRPYALEEFHRHPQAELRGSGFIWPRQRWYLPYCFALYVVSTLTVSGMIIAKKAQTGFNALFAELRELLPPTVMTLLQERVQDIMGSMVLPVVLVGGFLVLVASMAAFELARQQHAGTDAVERSIVSLVAGNPALPRWVSTDEVGDLSRATATAFEQLRDFSFSLGESAQLLGESAEELGVSHKRQTEALSTHAAALQETQVTAQEIKQTSLLAAQKAEGVLKQAERADQIGRLGEGAIEQSLQGLTDIYQQVQQMATSIRSLDERTRQIADITQTVKALADRSNMLALNAAIEAVRSGEHGKGFAVVAREIRNLANQSIKATDKVHDVLEELSNAISSTAAMSEQGSDKVHSSLAQVQGFGDNIRQLTNIVRDNVSSVRQISAAVTQQNQGIGQIFQAMSDLQKIMDQTMASLQTSDEAATQMRSVVSRVTGFVEKYGWQNRSEPAEGQGGPGKKTANV
ncbi:methyl-accepting chemotaxis protein [Archangium lipolyticum]|uniref:methyl-accepting chemotaxis protein n=1 Tax=Archangium lipolyticum TaxID=2970465 RepID=UPI002149A858|nr:methyl-accepting chemotaxis protein [Archangium lipolyticum]